ncbi:agmatine deiminase family protein [Sphingorhabdus sp. Alg239-R122]|uniref:agmatine deiminase family protein n=1 Tax=Sphingorhabdus sp. Alg239-R122 TaxID=2305989 RepID=UPI0013D9A2CD|nr:agmatine deiminase family protein [Sphingorhabdus sp. Alg239-R122]
MTYRQPPEWASHDFVWIGFPHDSAEWPGQLKNAQAEIAAFANAVQQSGEQVRLVCRDMANADAARTLVGDHIHIRIHRYGDIWLRDTGPLVVRDARGRVEARLFDFNGWGGKYDMDGDREIGAALVREAGLNARKSGWVLEGGAIDVDGSGLAVTTAQCLLNPNRNPKLGREDIEARLRDDLGLQRILWLGDGLEGDHTDGHVDNLARFVRPNLLALSAASGEDDPNAAIYADTQARAACFGVDTVLIPSPGRVVQDGEIQPASHMNFYIGNHAVIVPVYGTPYDAPALEAIGAIFPGRQTVGLSAKAILSGGGSFHCASQQMPA